MSRPVQLPRLYAILDVSCFAPQRGTAKAMADFAVDLAAGGVMTWWGELLVIWLLASVVSAALMALRPQ